MKAKREQVKLTNIEVCIGTTPAEVRDVLQVIAAAAENNAQSEAPGGSHRKDQTLIAEVLTIAAWEIMSGSAVHWRAEAPNADAAPAVARNAAGNAETHRALLHTTFGVSLCEQFFGDLYKRSSDGGTVATRTVAEVHILEDMKAILTPADFLREMPIRSWMNGLSGPQKRAVQSLRIPEMQGPAIPNPAEGEP